MSHNPIKKGKVYLLPTYLSDSNDTTFVSAMVTEMISTTNNYLVENVRTARRFISSLKLEVDISSLHFTLMDKHFDSQNLPESFEVLNQGENLIVLSEAGMPGIADPGRVAVSYAHRNDFEVVALQGTSSILLALVSSGFNGQEFTFHGYLPIDKDQRVKKLLDLEREVNVSGYTQLFMETPYRNLDLFKTLLETCSEGTNLFIGANLGSHHPYCSSRLISAWKRMDPDIHKIPAIFAMGKPS